MCGRNVAVRSEPPVYVATKTAARDVLTPGLTGLPIFARNAASIARSLSSASSPPTMYPRGQLSWNSTCGRCADCETGTTTHGPATRTQI